VNERLRALPVREVLGVRIHAATMADAVSVCDEAIERDEPILIGVVNAAKLVGMRQDAVLRRSVEEADLVVADGMAVVWASRLLGSPLPERVAGIELFEALLGLAKQRQLSVYLLGARPEVLEQLRKRLEEIYPGAQIVGSRDGYFREEEAEEVARSIAAARPDLLFVGMPSPRKEIFLERFGTQMGARVSHGVGGSFDVLAGHTRRAPESWQRLGLEWLFRLLQEPRRMWRRYLVTNMIFIALVVKEIFRKSALGSALRP
jgi:N-acetylglucosaminyldiphosphoundecaprenol N-acetyl-beta-D-mannosaminyltransferase